MRKTHSAGTYSRLGELLDVLGLCVSDEVVVQDHVRLQAQHFASCRQQQQAGIAVGEEVAEKSGIFKMHRLLRETAGVHEQHHNEGCFSFSNNYTQHCFLATYSKLESKHDSKTITVFWWPRKLQLQACIFISSRMKVESWEFCQICEKPLGDV